MSQTQWIIALLLLSNASLAIAEQTMDATCTGGQHFVIMVRDKEVYIDMGERDGIIPGTVVEIFRDTEQVVHPMTGEVIGEAPTVIGLVKITRASGKYSVGRVVKWIPQVRIRKLDRVWISGRMRPVSSIGMERQAPSGSVDGQPVPRVPPEGITTLPGRKPASGSHGLSKTRLLIPGLYQLGRGKALKSAFFFAGAFGLAGGGAYYKWKCRDAHQDYLDLPVGTSPEAFDAAFEAYRKRGRRGDVLLMAAGGIYLLNLIDGIFGGGSKGSPGLYLSGRIDQTNDKANLLLNATF